MSLKKIARNKNRDDVLKLFGPLTNRITSDHWQVYANQSQYERLVRGEKEGSTLTTYSLLRPSIFEGFKKVVVASACMPDTMFFRLFSAQGIELEPVKGKLRQDLRYEQHAHGDRITIYYAAEEAWSKAFRDKVVEHAESGTCMRLLDRIKTAVGDLFGNEPFLWMGNKDLPDSFFGLSGAERLPNTPHGLNEYQARHGVVVLSALNPPPAHFSFMEGKSISGEEMRTAHYRTAVYQGVMRCSIRNPVDETPKCVVVMDKDTAEWLAALFPGATLVPLPGMGVVPHKGKPGRPRRHASNTERVKAHRERQRREWLAQLDLINGTSVIAGRYPSFAEEVRAQMSEFACNENTYKEGDYVTPKPSSQGGTAYATVFSNVPLLHVEHDDEDSFIAGLRDLHQRVLASKEDAGVFSAAHFDPDKATDTGRGLDNITHVRGLWFDNDGGDLSHQEFADLFPYLRLVVWNTYSHTREKPRWRAFVPTTYAMSLGVHGLLMDQIVRVLNRAGYWGKRQLEKNKGIKVRRCHGFDESKFTPASLFYLPSQSKDPRHSFFVDYGTDPKRGPLDVHQWIENCILDLRPEPEPIPAVATRVEPPPVSEAGVRSRLEALRDALRAEQAQSHAGRQQRIIEQAVEQWRMTPPGMGHHGFFCLGAALQRAGLDPGEIKTKLYEESAYASSPKERRGEIKDIMRSLRRRGTFGR